MICTTQDCKSSLNLKFSNKINIEKGKISQKTSLENLKKPENYKIVHVHSKKCKFTKFENSQWMTSLSMTSRKICDSLMHSNNCKGPLIEISPLILSGLLSATRVRVLACTQPNIFLAHFFEHFEK